MDCGSFVYGSSMKSILSIIDPIHNTGIHLTMDAFCTSHLEFVCRMRRTPNYLHTRIFSLVTMLQIWRNNPSTWLSDLYSTCGCVPAWPSTTTWHKTAAYHSHQTLSDPTLDYHMTCCCNIWFMRHVRGITSTPYVPSEFCSTTLYIPGPHDGVYWQAIFSGIDRHCFHKWWPVIFLLVAFSLLKCRVLLWAGFQYL
jgi:hypothetical protein